MDDVASNQGVPYMYGLIQGPSNSIAPGKRPLSAITPTIVLKDGRVAIVPGSLGGGRAIFSSLGGGLRAISPSF